MINTKNNKDKYHFYIGNILTDEQQIRLLKTIRKNLRKKYKLKNFHWSHPFATNLIYLGYMDQTTADTYMRNLFSPLLKAISESFSPLECNYTGYKLTYDNTFYKVALEYTDTDNVLSKTIIPYLYNEGIYPVYEKQKQMPEPCVDIIFFEESGITNRKIDEIQMFIPKDKFVIDHLSLIKGTPQKLRMGAPSIHDALNLEEVQRFNFSLHEQKN
jgi:hypothetical protein